MKRLFRFLAYLFSIPKSIYFNFRSFPFRVAIQLPFYIHYNVKLGELHKGIISIDAPIQHFMIKYGVGGVKGIDGGKSQLWFQQGKVFFKGSASFGEGCSIRNNGVLIFGNHFGAGKNCFISCTDRIEFGDDVLMAWNTTVRDSDGHIMLYDGIRQGSLSSISIGNHVWLTANTTILKGVIIKNNSVVAYGSIVTKSFDEEGILIGGIPARKIRSNVNWEV